MESDTLLSLPSPDDRVAIGDLFARYCTALDRDDVAACVALFTEDGVFPHPPEEKDYKPASPVGMEVRFVTLHGNGLSDSLTSPTEDIIDAWTEEYGNHGPVIYDRGYGVAMAASLIEDYGLSFPAWFIVDPEMTVLHAQTGFGDWTTAEAIILAE